MSVKSKIKYKDFLESLDREDKDALHHVYCNSTISIAQLAEENKVSLPVMRRVLMEIMGQQGYLEAKLNRSAVRSSKGWRRYSYKHASTEKLFKILKLLIDTDSTFFEISKIVNCSRERVGQIANECGKYGISLNEERGKMLAGKNHYGKSIRGYPAPNRKVADASLNGRN